jgi:hypothetical protein
MQKNFILVVVFLISASLISAEETYRFNLGFGIEENMNTCTGIAFGGNVNASYKINEILDAGLKLTMSHNFERIMVLEPEILIRWYFLPSSKYPLFIQADLGSSLIIDDSQLYWAFLGGLTAGIRFPLNRWYVEPYIRGGYPFIESFGITAGFCF